MNDCLRIRRCLQLSQRELAACIQVAQPMISAIETGRRPLPAPRRRQLERLLAPSWLRGAHLTTPDIFTLTDEPGP